MIPVPPPPKPDMQQWTPPEWQVVCPPPIGKVTVRELPLERIVTALSPLAGLLEAGRQGKSWNLSQALLDTPEQVIDAVAAATGLDPQDVRELPAGKVIELLQVVIEAHRSFFFGIALLARIETLTEGAISKATIHMD